MIGLNDDPQSASPTCGIFCVSVSDKVRLAIGGREFAVCGGEFAGCGMWIRSLAGDGIIAMGGIFSSISDGV